MRSGGDSGKTSLVTFFLGKKVTAILQVFLPTSFQKEVGERSKGKHGVVCCPFSLKCLSSVYLCRICSVSAPYLLRIFSVSRFLQVRMPFGGRIGNPFPLDSGILRCGSARALPASFSKRSEIKTTAGLLSLWFSQSILINTKKKTFRY